MSQSAYAPLHVQPAIPTERTAPLFALSQGDYSGGPPGSPALPDTGSLVKVNANGTFSVVFDGLDRPSSVELIKNTAYVVTLTGEIWKIEDPAGPPHGAH